MSTKCQVSTKCLNLCSFRWLKSTLNLLTLSLQVNRCAGHNTDQAWNSNISKMVGVNIAFTRTFFKEHQTSFLMISRLIDFAVVVLQLLIFKVCGIIGISKIVLFDFSGMKELRSLIPKDSQILKVLFSVSLINKT